MLLMLILILILDAWEPRFQSKPRVDRQSQEDQGFFQICGQITSSGHICSISERKNACYANLLFRQVLRRPLRVQVSTIS